MPSTLISIVNHQVGLHQRLGAARRLAAGQKLNVDKSILLRAAVNPTLAFGTGEPNFHLDGVVQYQDGQNKSIQIPLSAHDVPLNSDLSAAATLRYYSQEGEAIGKTHYGRLAFSDRQFHLGQHVLGHSAGLLSLGV